ncbi:MAG: hypothetical protein ACPG3X_05165 [Opitutales bacterium]
MTNLPAAILDDSTLKTELESVGLVPASTQANITVEGIKALKEQDSKLINPVIHCGAQSIQVLGTVQTGQYFEYTGGETAKVYD